MVQQAYDSMARTPETRSLNLQGSIPLFSSVRIEQDQHTPRAAIYGADENSKGLEELTTDLYNFSNERLSDVHLASRKAIEAATRRFQAALWLQTMVGPIDLAAEPSEEELRLCLQNGLVLCNLVNKIHPGAVSKIVENPTPSSPPPQGAALSAYQYFENVRNFLVAIKELNLPTFQASDLEKGSLQMGSSAKVVDCILALKAYHEWQLSGGQGLWKLTGQQYKSPCSLKSFCRTGPSRSNDPRQSKVSNQAPRSWAFSGFDGPKNLSDELGSVFGEFECMKMGFNSYEDSDFSLQSNADFGTAWVQQVSRKFDDVLNLNQEQKIMPVVDMPRGLEIVSSESLMKLIMLSLHNKQPEEIPVLVEFMLRKVMEEFERRLACKEQQQYKQCAVRDPCSAMTDCSQLQHELQALQLELKRLQDINCQRSLVLDSQTKEVEGLKRTLSTTKLEFQNLQDLCSTDMKTLDSKVKILAQAAEEYYKVLAENRELYNQVQDLKGNIRVFCRVRPFLPGQMSSNSTVDFIGEMGSIVIANPGCKLGKDHRKSFTFNKVFGPSTTQDDVFLDTQPLIRSVLDGFNVCIFAYGQTGSGKTYTMTGPNNPTPADWGVNFRALSDLFQISQNRTDHMAYEVGVQMMEIYNEQVRDLLCSDGSNKKLEIRNNSQQNGLNVPAASMISVKCTDDVLDLITLGQKNRAVGATALNERSSRSHSVVTVHVKGTELASGAILRGCLHLVDLAGSERVDKSEATGDRLKEAQHINKSLSALGDVIASLAQKNAHVPYRNSKLTQLLQDSLGGQAKTLMFVHVSPDEESYSETISTLKFAERVASVELGAAHSNKESGEVRDLKDQVVSLKDALARKDAELERLQKEAKCKPSECFPDRVRIKPLELLSQCQPQRTSLEAIHSQGARRQPLEDVQNLEIRRNSSHGAQKRLSSGDGHLMEPERTHMPGSTAVSYEEDTVRRRASKLRRQSTILSNEERRTAPNIELETPASFQGPSRNKIRREISVEQQAHTPYERKENCRENSSFASQNDATPIEQSTQGIGHGFSLTFNGGKKTSQEIMFAGTSTTTTMTCSFEGTTGTSTRQFNFKPFRSQGDDDGSMEMLIRSRRGTPPFDEENAASACPENVEKLWKQEAGSGGKHQSSAERRRVPSVKQSLNSLPQRDTGTTNRTQRHTRSRRHSLIGGGSGNTPGSEVKKSAPMATTMEAKLIAVSSSEGGSVECYAKAKVPPTQTMQAAHVQKASKRWM